MFSSETLVCSSIIEAISTALRSVVESNRESIPRHLGGMRLDFVDVPQPGT